jgi:hypothetical protein
MIGRSVYMSSEMSAEDCGGLAVCGSGIEADRRDSVRDSGARTALLLTTQHLRRLNVHHFSCWQAPKCHQRMYVMDLPLAKIWARPDGRRVPRLYRVEDGSRVGKHNFSNLLGAWDFRADGGHFLR